jgi:glyoxylase-like metal-dependent hydrolase (beta-lactamase superfamily II)
VLEAHRGMPPVEHDDGLRQRLALQPPQPGIAVAQHYRRRVRLHASRGERLLECVGRDRGAVARESEAGLVAIGVDHLASDHLKMTLLVPVPTADIAAIKPNHDRFGWLRRGLLRRHGGMRLHNFLADPQRPVSHRAGVLRPADRQQVRQQGRDLAERCQRCIAGCQIRQFRRHSRRLEVQDSEALCGSGTLTGTGEQPSDPMPGIEAVFLPGHTPGHTGFILRSGSDALFLWADVIHVPGIQYAHPEAAVRFDVDPSAARESRKRAFDRASADKMLVAGIHHDFPLFGHLRAHGQAFAWDAEVWSPIATGRVGNTVDVAALCQFSLEEATQRK